MSKEQQHIYLQKLIRIEKSIFDLIKIAQIVSVADGSSISIVIVGGTDKHM